VKKYQILFNWNPKDWRFAYVVFDPKKTAMALIYVWIQCIWFVEIRKWCSEGERQTALLAYNEEAWSEPSAILATIDCGERHPLQDKINAALERGMREPRPKFVRHVGPVVVYDSTKGKP
jgi:hypothetical protein